MAERRKGIGGRRFRINLEDKTWKVSHKSCDFCGGEVESVPMLDNVCYSCYQVLVRNPESVTAYKLHKACTLGSVMRDCDNCKFQPRPIRTSAEVDPRTPEQRVEDEELADQLATYNELRMSGHPF